MRYILNLAIPNGAARPDLTTSGSLSPIIFRLADLFHIIYILRYAAIFKQLFTVIIYCTFFNCILSTECQTQDSSAEIILYT